MRKLVTVLTLLAALAFSLSAPAAAPVFVPVQGYLTDADGAPIDGEVSLVLSLWDSISGGAQPLFTETQNVLVEQGFFTLYLGGAGTPDLALALFRDHGATFLGIAVNGEAEMAPRLPMGSVPYAGYAQYAGDALTLGGRPLDDFRLGADQVSWDDLTDVPDNLLDGDADTLAGLTCGNGHVAKYDTVAGTWICADDIDTDTTLTEAEVDAMVADNGYALSSGLAVVATTGDFGDLLGVPADLTDGDADTLAGLTCADGQLAAWDDAAGVWACADDADSGGDITAVIAGNGLAGGGTTGDISISATARGVVFTRWGRNVCPTDTSLVYSGYAAGSASGHPGSGSNTLCLTDAPTWDVYTDSNENGGLLYGVEYEMSSYGLASIFGGLQDQDAPCAVCLDAVADLELMLPGSQSCPSGWNTRYAGYLMSSHYTQNAGEFVCVDRNAQARPGGAANTGGALWQPVEAECGTLPCAPYVQDREITCAVCTR